MPLSLTASVSIDTADVSIGKDFCTHIGFRVTVRTGREMTILAWNADVVI